MGQQRQDTYEQRAAKQRVADRRRCPSCQRRSALSTRFEVHGDWKPGGTYVGVARTCLYCGHHVARPEVLAVLAEIDSGSTGEER